MKALRNVPDQRHDILVASAVAGLMAAVMMAASFTPWFVDPDGSGGWSGTSLPGDRPGRLYLAGDDLFGVNEGVLTFILGATALLLGAAAAMSGPRAARLFLLGAAAAFFVAVAAVVSDAVSILIWGTASDDAWAIPGMKFGGGLALLIVGGMIGVVYALRGALAETSNSRVWRALTTRMSGLPRLLDDRIFSQVGAACGALFVACSASAPLLVGELLRTDHTRDQIRHWTFGHTGAIALSALLLFIAALAFTWFLRAFVRWVAEFGRRDGRVAGVVITGILLSGTVYVLGLAILSGIAQNPEGTAWTSTLWRVSAIAPPLAALGVVLMAGGISTLGRRAGVLPSRIVFLGWGAVLVGFATTVGLAADPSAFRWWAILGLLVTAVWVLGISWEMWRRPVPAGAAS